MGLPSCLRTAIAPSIGDGDDALTSLVSPDGRFVLYLYGYPTSTSSAPSGEIFDTSSGQMVSVFKSPLIPGYYSSTMTVSPCFNMAVIQYQNASSNDILIQAGPLVFNGTESTFTSRYQATLSGVAPAETQNNFVVVIGPYIAFVYTTASNELLLVLYNSCLQQIGPPFLISTLAASQTSGMNDISAFTLGCGYYVAFPFIPIANVPTTQLEGLSSLYIVSLTNIGPRLVVRLTLPQYCNQVRTLVQGGIAIVALSMRATYLQGQASIFTSPSLSQTGQVGNLAFYLFDGNNICLSRCANFQSEVIIGGWHPSGVIPVTPQFLSPAKNNGPKLTVYYSYPSLEIVGNPIITPQLPFLRFSPDGSKLFFGGAYTTGIYTIGYYT